MATMVARSTQLSQTTSMTPQEKGSRNKRKFRSDPVPVTRPECQPSASEGVTNMHKLSVNRFLGSGSSGERDGNRSSSSKDDNDYCYMHNLPLCPKLNFLKRASQACSTNLRFGHESSSSPSQLCSSREQSDSELEVSHDADWNSTTEGELEELVLSNLDVIYRSAIRKIASVGYSQDEAMKAVLRYGRCFGCNDPVLNIVENTLLHMKKEKSVDLKVPCFQDLLQLEKHILAEMICVLKGVRPIFSTGDAMWCLLVSDMNVSNASAMFTNPSKDFHNDDNPSLSAATQQKTEANPSSVESDTAKLNQESGDSDHGPNQPRLSVNSEPPAKYSFLETMPAAFQNAENFHPLAAPSQKENIAGCRHLMEDVDVQETGFSLGSSAKEPSVDFEEQEQNVEHAFRSEVRSISKPNQTEQHKKNHLNNFKRAHLRQKPGHGEHGHRGNVHKASYRAGKNGNIRRVILDRKWDSGSSCSSVPAKDCSSVVVNASVSTDGLQPDSNLGKPKDMNGSGLSCNTRLEMNNMEGQSGLSGTCTDLALSFFSRVSETEESHPIAVDQKPDDVSSEHRECTLSHAFGAGSPHNVKDDRLLKLVNRARDLQNQLQEWTDWAQQKVMQAARRLSKEKAELKSLRLEKDEAARMKKEKQLLEENTMKKLAEMETALAKASFQVGHASSAMRRLEAENSGLMKEMETAKLLAAESATNCLEVSRREKKIFSKVQSWGRQKDVVHLELSNERHKLSQLCEELAQAKDFLSLLEARWKSEDKAKDEALHKVNFEGDEKRKLESSAKIKEEALRAKAEMESQESKIAIQRLENEIAQLRLTSDSSKIAALRWEVDQTYACRLMWPHSLPSAVGAATQPISDPSDPQNLNVVEVPRERECVMCLTDEMSVVFLPCAHQVVCRKCNDLHEKQGMKDCPSCRSPIIERIFVRFAEF